MIYCKHWPKAASLLFTAVANFSLLSASDRIIDFSSQPPFIDKSHKESRGPRGHHGPRGEHGKKGKRGAAGPSGPQGMPGTPGPTGAVGPTGATGSTGPAGAVPAAFISAYLNAGFPVQGAFTLIEFDTTQFPPVGVTLTPPGIFTVTNGGKYLISWSLLASSNTINDSFNVDLQINGVAITPSPFQEQFFPTTGVTNTISGSVLLELNAGDEVTLVGSTSSVLDIINVNNPTISIFEIAQ